MSSVFSVVVTRKGGRGEFEEIIRVIPQEPPAQVRVLALLVTAGSVEWLGLTELFVRVLFPLLSCPFGMLVYTPATNSGRCAPSVKA